MGTDSEKRPEFRDLEAVLRGEVATSLTGFLEDVHAADLADWMENIDPPDRVRIVVALTPQARSEVLIFAEDPLREEVLQYLDVPQIVEVVEELPADEAVDLLALTEEGTEEQVLRALSAERSQGLRQLLRYDAETVGGLMTSEFVTVEDDVHVGDAIKHIRAEGGPASEEEIGVFVVDADGRPVGFVSDRDLLTTPIHTPVREVMETDLITVNAQDDQEEVAQLVYKYSFSAVPVVSDDGVLIGVVAADDAQDVLTEEAEEDILRLVGTSPEEHQTRLPVLTRVRHRLPLQALTVLGGLITAWILDRALPTSLTDGSSTADILRYLPIIIGLAGNVGIQSSTILVRAFATGEVSQDRELSVLGSEVLVGFLIGTICGVTTTLVAGFMEGGDAQALIFGSSVGLAITIAVVWAAFLGCVVPILCQRFGIDPAIVAGPFLITLSDISGASIFVGTSSLFLNIGTWS
jgi:magnesium transporter